MKMETALSSYVDEEIYDISQFSIEGHALSQYAEKCFPGKSLIETMEQMRKKMANVRKANINKRVRDNRLSYIDEDEIIYITEKTKIITVFPNQRIFVSKTFFSNKRTGRKYL